MFRTAITSPLLPSTALYYMYIIVAFLGGGHNNYQAMIHAIVIPCYLGANFEIKLNYILGRIS